MSSRHFRPRQRSNRRYNFNRRETTFETAKRYGLVAVMSGLGLAFGANAWERADARRAYLEALPAGYVFSGCDQVRAAGIAPLYSAEPGFSERLDGDGDGIGCEPYR